MVNFNKKSSLLYFCVSERCMFYTWLYCWMELPRERFLQDEVVHVTSVENHLSFCLTRSQGIEAKCLFYEDKLINKYEEEGT